MVTVWVAEPTSQLLAQRGQQENQRAAMASLQGTSERGLGKGQQRRDAEENISGKEKVVEMT